MCYNYREVASTNEGSEELLSFEEAMALIDECDENAIERPVQIAVKYDMGWQRRSSGRKYNSLSGVGSMIGNASGKVIGYGVRNKDCRICTYHSNKGSSPAKTQLLQKF